MKDSYIDKFVEKLGDNLLEDLKRAFPKHLETILEQRLKGIRSALEPLERIEQENKLIGRDVEDMKIAQKQMQEDIAQLKINSNTLPKKVEAAVSEGQSQIAKDVVSDIKDIAKKKRLWGLWGKK